MLLSGLPVFQEQFFQVIGFPYYNQQKKKCKAPVRKKRQKITVEVIVYGLCMDGTDRKKVIQVLKEKSSKAIIK